MSRSQLVARNVVSTIITQILSWGLTFTVTLYAPRYLGDIGMGQFALAGSVAAICSLIVSVGASTVLVREIARDHDRAAELITSALILRVVLGFVALLVAYFAAIALNYEPSVRVLIVVAMCGMLIAQFNDVLTSALIGLEQMPRQNLVSLVEKLVSTGLMVLFIVQGRPWWMLMATGIASNSISLIVSVVALKSSISSLVRPRIESMMSLLRHGLPFMTTAVFVAIYGQSDALVLSKLIHSHKLAQETIGWYALGRRLNGTVLFIPVAVTTALLPTLSRMSKEEPASFMPMVRRIMNLMIIAVVPFAAVMIFAPLQILHFLHYPESFVPSVPVLAVLGGGAIVWYLSQVAGTALIASDRQGVLSRITGIAALISVPLCIACSMMGLRFFHNAATGAAIADIAVEGYLLIAYMRELPEASISMGSVKTLLRAGIASAPLVVVLLYTGHQALLIGAIFGAVVYVPLCMLVHCFDAGDIAVVRQAFSRRTAVEPVAGAQYAAK